MTPETIQQSIQSALENQTPLEILGQGSKRRIGPPIATNNILDLSALTGILFYEPEELVLSALAGTPIAEMESLLQSKGQQLAFEPMDYGPLLGGSGGQGHNRRRARHKLLRPAPPESGRGARSYSRR